MPNIKYIEDLHVLEEMIYCTNKMQNLKRGGNGKGIEESTTIIPGEIAV
jgi:hypothetical protein